MKASIHNDFAVALDPVRFAQSVSINPDPWQADLLFSTKRHIILLCGRQAGKTTIVAVLALHHALNNPDALVLVLSPSLRQSSELFKVVTSFYQELERPIPAEIETALTLQLSNGSRIASLPGKEQTVRGFSGVSLLLIDEAARVSDELYYAVRPMLAVSQGRIILLSTPCGKRGFFFHEWEKGHNWLKIKVTANQCPRISQEFLTQERRDLGERWFAQEYLCSFEESETALFHYDVIQRALSADVEELDFDLNVDIKDRTKITDWDANEL
ncbi:MAG: terminase large subunit domain-containing protein [Halobacteriota archaeon]